MLPKRLFISGMHFDCDLRGTLLREDGDRRLFEVVLDSESTSKDRLAVGKRRLLLVLHFRARASKHFLVHCDGMELKMSGNR